MAFYSKDLLCGDDFDAVLAIYRSYRCSANASEAVKKIAIGKKDEEFCRIFYANNWHRYLILPKLKSVLGFWSDTMF